MGHCSVQPLTVMFKKSYHQDKEITYIELSFDFLSDNGIAKETMIKYASNTAPLQFFA